MSVPGISGIPSNYDNTAQSAGVPLETRPEHHEQEDIAAAAQTDASATRATSMTEVAHSDKDNQEKPASTPTKKKEDDGIEIADEDDGSEMERRSSIVQALARKYSTQRADIPPGTNPFMTASDDGDSPLNPNSPHFSARAWAKAVVDMVTSSGADFRTSGIAFQNLNVFGFGQATDYQKDVANIWISAAGAVRGLLGHGKRRIDILRDFDGVVHKGEMLVVLGPPGSGCSTLLKTIAGEMNGLNTDDASYFNYQGEFTH